MTVKRESQSGFVRKGPLKFISFQPLSCGQGHLPLDQVAQNPIQPGLKHLPASFK